MTVIPVELQTPQDTSVEELLDTLAETRGRTLALISGLDRDRLEAVHSPLLSPLVWDLAHIAAFEDLWITRRLDRSPLRPELMSTYDADETPRALRGELDLLDTDRAYAYAAAVRDQSLSLIPQLAPGDQDVVELVIRHEQQHNETMLQLIALAHLPSPFAGADRTAGAARGSGTGGGLEFLDIPGGVVSIGTGPDGFAYDNERPLHQVEVASCQLARTPATNADWQEFVDAGGYARVELWSPAGWAWREREGVVRPLSWTGDGTHWILDELRPLELDRELPVIHISWFEAEAFANFHGARLPTEFEWEAAATVDAETGVKRVNPWGESPVSRVLANVDQLAGGPERSDAHSGATPNGLQALIGDVWEWTASAFLPYPGFVAYPYREYSEQFFGGPYRVLRGGSWATRARVISPTFRNWDLPERRQIFSGVRLARDAE